MKRNNLHWKILTALVLAGIAGWLSGKNGNIMGLKFYDVYDFLGKIFLRGLKMVVIPLIVSSIITGMSSMGEHRSFARLGMKTLFYYIFTTVIAVITGLCVVNIFQPGLVNGSALKQFLNATGSHFNPERIHGRGVADIIGVFLRMIPVNIVNSASNNRDMLSVIFFSILFGYYSTQIKEPGKTTLSNFFRGVSDVMINITNLVIFFAPIGVFGLVAKVVAATGFAAFRPMLFFFFTVIVSLSFHFFISLPILLKLAGKMKNPYVHFRSMCPALLMAFSTSSSSATLPVTMECVENNAKVSSEISSFVLPLGATVNMDGTALYECVAAIFLAQAYGLHLSFATQFTIVFIAVLTSIGVAGIPSASLVAIAIILTSVGIPVEGIGLLMVVDRILDMCRTSVNIFSDSCCAVIIDSSEKNSAD